MSQFFSCLRRQVLQFKCLNCFRPNIPSPIIRRIIWFSRLMLVMFMSQSWRVVKLWCGQQIFSIVQSPDLKIVDFFCKKQETGSRVWIFLADNHHQKFFDVFNGGCWLGPSRSTGAQSKATADKGNLLWANVTWTAPFQKLLMSLMTGGLYYKAPYEHNDYRSNFN